MNLASGLGSSCLSFSCLRRNDEPRQSFRPIVNPNWAIDAEIEFRDEKGRGSGTRIYLQVKAGDSHLRQRKDGTEIFQLKKLWWADQWQTQPADVYLLIGPSDGDTRWMNVTKYLKTESKGRKSPVRQIVFDGEAFNALNLMRLRDRLLPPPD